MAASILVVDDDPAVRSFTVETLRAAGYHVFDAASGAEAVAACGRQVPGLIVLDNSMPGMTGVDVARRLREDSRTASVPIVMLSGLNSDQDQWDGWRAGIDVYLTKPFEGEDLLAHVNRLLRLRAHAG